MTFLHSHNLTQVCLINSEHMVESTAELLQKGKHKWHVGGGNSDVEH